MISGLRILFTLVFIKKKFFLVQRLILRYIVYILINSLNIYYPTNISYMFRVDVISYRLIILSFWIVSLILLARFIVYKNKNFCEFFVINLLILILILYLTFSVVNLLLFYIFFESSLICILILILGWGYQPERIQAGIYLLFYTIFISLPILLGVFYILVNINSLTINLFILNISSNWLLFIVIILVFLVKIPIVFIHLWLVKAHVEAPVAGSIMLAAILLKLGGYGLIRVLIIFQNLVFKINYLIIILSLIGGVYLRILCLQQVDMKVVVAYSSVVHIRIVLRGLFLIISWRMIGAYIVIIGHGLCSSGLFAILNLNYERLRRRRLLVNKGIIRLFPSLRLWWFLLLSSNISAPPSLNLLGEIYLLNRLVRWLGGVSGILCLLLIFSVIYRLYLFSFRQHGVFIKNLKTCLNITRREFLILSIHWIPLNILFINIDFISI